MKDILLIDDSYTFCQSIVDLVEEETSWNITTASDGEQGLQKLQEEAYKVVLLDLKMPGMSGLDVLRKLEELNLIPKNYIIVLTGEITIENAVSSLQFGARDFMQKPYVAEFPENFLKRVEKGFGWQRERLVNEQLKLEKRLAIEESQLITKSVGHDMSGSYYGSLMLRLQGLHKRTSKLVAHSAELVGMLHNGTEREQITEGLARVNADADNALNRVESVIELMQFFKQLGEKLKHLGSAISIDSAHKKPFDLTRAMQAAMRIFTDTHQLPGQNININTQFTEQPLMVNGSEDDIVRVFLNLIENSVKAMDGQGELQLTTMRLNGHAKAIVKDTGCGIAPDDLDAIWRPDFTKWKNQTGTGLGLMICRKAVQNSGGSITVNSQVGVGTTFELVFEVN